MTAEEQRIEQIVDNLGCSIAEAKEVLEYDKSVDKAKAKEKLAYDLTAEQEKFAKKYHNAPNHKTTGGYKWDTRKRKENTTKKGIIADVVKFLTENGYENIEVLNDQKLIAFSVGEKNYTLDLVEKRKPKK